MKPTAECAIAVRRRFVAVLGGVVACFTAGCTSLALQSSAVSVGATVGPVLEQQTLDNLGRFIDDSRAIPSHVLLTSGTVEIINAAVPAVKSTFVHAATTSMTRDVNVPLTFQWKESWSITPVSTGHDLKMLQDHYNEAVSKNRAEDAAQGCVSANKDKWLCVDPKLVSTAARAVPLVYKGTYHGHEIWVVSEGFSSFVFDINTKATNAVTKSLNTLQFQLIQ